MAGDPIKDALYYSVSEYERKLNPNITDGQFLEKVNYARENPEKYFAETYKKIKGQNIDEATINRVRETTGIPLDVNKLPKTDVNFVDNDKRETLNASKELSEIQSKMKFDMEASDEEMESHFKSKVFPNIARYSGRKGANYDFELANYLKQEKDLRIQYDQASNRYSEAFEKAKNNLSPVEADKFFKDTEKITSGKVKNLRAISFKGNDAAEQRQNAYLDSERYFNILAEDFQKKQSSVVVPVEQQMAASIINGVAPEVPEGFVPTKEFKDFMKSYENLAKQRDINVSQFGSEITKGNKMTYNEQLEDYKSILEEDRDLSQNWFLPGKDKYRGKGVPSISRTWVNGAVLNLVDGVSSGGDAFYLSKLEKEGTEALKNNDYDKYLKVQRELALQDFKEDKRYAFATDKRSDVTAPVWEHYVEVDGFRLAVDAKGNFQRVVNNNGFTVHNLSEAEKAAVSKYQANPKGYKKDEGFSKSWGKSVVNMAGTSAVEMVPMIMGSVVTSPLRGMGVVGKIASGTISSAPMFTSVYGKEFDHKFKETGDWSKASSYATFMAGIESVAEWAGGRLEMKTGDVFGGRPVRDVIAGAGRRAADAAVNARNLANFSFTKEFIKQLGSDIGQEEAEEIFTMFAQNAVSKMYGDDTELDANEVLSTILVTPLATAPFSVVTNAANYRTPGSYRDMINAAADNYDKTVEIFSEIGSKMTENKSEAEKEKILNELKAKMDIVGHVKNRKEFYAGNVAFQSIDFEKEETDLVEHYIFEEALAKANGKEVDNSEKIKPIIAKARKRGLLNSIKEEADPIIPDLQDSSNEEEQDFVFEDKNEQEEFPMVEWWDYLDNGIVQDERLYKIAEKVKNNEELLYTEKTIYNSNKEKIDQVISGVYGGSESMPSESYIEPEKKDRYFRSKGVKRMARQEFVFNSKKDSDGFVSKRTVGKDGGYESISNDFGVNDSNHKLSFNIGHNNAQGLAVEAIDIIRQTGIPARIDVADLDNLTKTPLVISFKTENDAKTFYDLLKDSQIYKRVLPSDSKNRIGHIVDEKVQYSDRNLKSLSRAVDVYEKAEQDGEGNYLYYDNGDFISLTEEDINSFTEMIDSPKRSWENASISRFSETVEAIQPASAPKLIGNDRTDSRIDTVRNPNQVQTRVFDEKEGFEKINAKTDLTLGHAFDYVPGERKQVDVYKKGKKGTMFVNEGGQVTFESGNTIEELGNIEDLAGNTFKELGYVVPNVLNVSKKGEIVIGNRYFINPYSHAEGAINLNDDGSIKSVDVVEKILFTGQRVRREFEGQQAIDIATALVVNELKFNEDYKTFFENYTPTWRDTRFIPSKLTFDRLVEELTPHFQNKPRMALETAKMYFEVAKNMHQKYPERYSSPARYIIDRVLAVEDIDSEISSLMGYLENMAQNPSLSQDERDSMFYELDRIARVNIEEEERYLRELESNKLIKEIKSLPLTHVSLDPENTLGMGENEMIGTYISTERGGNRYMNAYTIEQGAQIYDVEVDIKNPYDAEAEGEDAVSLMQKQFRRAIGAYIYEKGIEGDIYNLLMETESFDDPIIDNFPDFGPYLAKAVTNYLVESGYDSYYSRESDTREGYLVVFNKDAVKFKPQNIFDLSGKKRETIEDLKNSNAAEYELLISGEAEERRKKGIATVNGVVYRRQEEIGGVYGNKGTVVFAEYPRVEVPFRYKLVNILDLVPSHLSGRINPMHFISDAQPKDRSGQDSGRAVFGFTHAPVVDQIIIEIYHPYSGIPVINKRGEVIQGNNRTEGIMNGYLIKNTTVRDYLLENIEKFGFTIEDANSVGENVFIVREVQVDDNMAIELGNYDVKDLETGSKRLIDENAVARRIPYAVKASIMNKLFLNYDNQTLNALVRQNSSFLYDIISPLLNASIKNTITNADGSVNADGVSGFENVIIQFLFDNGDPNLRVLFENMPVTVQDGIISSLPFIFSVSRDASLIPEIQKAIVGYSDMKGTGLPYGQWANQGDIFSGVSNNQIYTPLEMKLIEIFDNAKKIDDIVGKKTDTNFFKYSALARPKQEGLMFEDEIGGRSKVEAVLETFNVPYYDRSQEQKEIVEEGTDEIGETNEEEFIPGEDNDQIGNDGTDIEGGEEAVDIPVLREVKNHVDFNVTTVISENIQDDVQLQMGYKYRVDLSYPMDSFSPLKNKAVYFKDQPGDMDINDEVQKFIYEISDDLREKEETTDVEDKLISTMDNLKNKLLAKRNVRVQESVPEVTGDSGTGEVTKERISYLLQSNPNAVEGLVDIILQLDDDAYVSGDIRIEKKDIIEELYSNLPDGVDEIIDVKFIGSRIYGNDREDSDLDVLVEYSGDMREDDYFNFLHDEDETNTQYEGIDIDFNPIKANKSGTIAEQYESQRRYLIQQATPDFLFSAYTRAEQEGNNNLLVSAMKGLLNGITIPVVENAEEEINNLLSIIQANPMIADQILAEAGINVNEIITFTDENGNPC